MGLLIRHSTAHVTAQNYTDADGNVIGVAIDTPSGVLVWVHDYDAQPLADGFLHLWLDPADDFDSAERKIREHAESYADDEPENVGAPH